jgi:hypothetical protein
MLQMLGYGLSVAEPAIAVCAKRKEQEALINGDNPKREITVW